MIFFSSTPKINCHRVHVSYDKNFSTREEKKPITLTTLRYSAMADLPFCESFRAVSSHTQQCTPLLPEYTHRRCSKPKSSVPSKHKKIINNNVCLLVLLDFKLHQYCKSHLVTCIFRKCHPCIISGTSRNQSRTSDALSASWIASSFRERLQCT